MDKIYALLTDLETYGWLGIFLAILYITDIPKSFFSALIKWFFEKKDKEYWPAKPTRSAFILPIVGSRAFRKTKLIRLNFIKELINIHRSKISQLFNEIASVKVNFRHFQSRSNIEFSSKTFNVINGIPGVGKSSFILNYLEQKLSSNKLNYVFYFNSYSINGDYKGLKSEQDDINIDQVWKILGKYNLDNSGLSSTVLSYLLNYKFVYFIIDGIDKEPALGNVIGNLNRYINKYHKNNKKIRVLVSSRITKSEHQRIFISNFDLLPPSTEEIRDFFFSKSEELQMNLLNNPDFGPLVDSQNSLLRFDENLTKTPLFVEVALVILKEKGLSNLVNEFHQSVGKIYKVFIQVLFERSAKGDGDYTKFYVLYRALAYKTWQSDNELDIGDVADIFQNTPYTIQFLIESGLLIPKDRTLTKYSFIHKTIPDILSIEVLAANGDFSYFKTKEIVGEDLRAYLKDEVKNVNQYILLLNANPSIAAALFDRLFFNKISGGEFSQATRMIARSCLEYISQIKILKTSDSESILKIFKNLSEYQGQLQQIILAEVDYYPKSESVLLILLSLQNSNINDYIIGLIQTNVSKNILTEILHNNQYLKKIVDPYFEKPITNEDDRKIILFALISDINNDTNFYKKKYADTVDTRSDEEVLFFLSKDKIRVEVFFKGYIHRHMSATNRLNRILSQVNFDEIFLPKGEYLCSRKLISNKKPITFSKTAHRKTLNESSLYDAISKFQTNVNYNLWDYDQFQIAYDNFQGFAGLKSLFYNDVQYEAVKENNKYKVSFAYFESNKSDSNITIIEHSNQVFNQTVIWRAINVY